MKAIRTLLSYLIFTCFASISFAEPANLQIAKDHLKYYVSSGQYAAETQKIADKAKKYLAQQIAANAKAHPPKKLALVLDIDETSLSNYPDMVKNGFGGSLDEINLNEDRGDDPVISPTLQLYNYAKQNGVAVFFVTGRPEWMRHSTIKNLNNAGYKNWDGLILKSEQFKGKPAEEYKTVVRKQLTDKGYTIVVNVGDQESDFIGGYSEKNYKLPNPFYFIP